MTYVIEICSIDITVNHYIVIMIEMHVYIKIYLVTTKYSIKKIATSAGEKKVTTKTI